MRRRQARRTELKGAPLIEQTLRERIRRREIPIGAILPTERELQAEFGVSRSTVRRALSLLVQSGWAEASPNRGAIAQHGPVEAPTRNVAFIDHGSGMQRDLFFAIGSRLQTHGYHLVHVDSRLHGVEGAIEYAAGHGFAAALVWSKVGFPDAARIEPLMADMPLLALDHSLQTVSTDLVTLDNFGGSREAVRHLASLGCRRIAITGMMDMLEVNHQRFSGWLMGLFDSGLEPKARDICFCLTSSARLDADTLTLERRLKDPDRPDGLFVMNDFLLPDVLQAAAGAGLRVPEDLAVAVFGRTWRPETGLEDRVAVVEIDWDAVADAVVRRLLVRLARPLTPPETIRLPVRLVPAASSGPRAEGLALQGR
ncbi:MAG: GntR family transcriptional regulator [Fimbriimonadales bacterium]|nr:GntR family transcriptional regulator [Fimbriimonadales bacterium]